jgi:hypothetical protein
MKKATKYFSHKSWDSNLVVTQCNSAMLLSYVVIEFNVKLGAMPCQ